MAFREGRRGGEPEAASEDQGISEAEEFLKELAETVPEREDSEDQERADLEIALTEAEDAAMEAAEVGSEIDSATGRRRRPEALLDALESFTSAPLVGEYIQRMADQVRDAQTSRERGRAERILEQVDAQIRRLPEVIRRIRDLSVAGAPDEMLVSTAASMQFLGTEQNEIGELILDCADCFLRNRSIISHTEGFVTFMEGASNADENFNIQRAREMFDSFSTSVDTESENRRNEVQASLGYQRWILAGQLRSTRGSMRRHLERTISDISDILDRWNDEPGSVDPQEIRNIARRSADINGMIEDLEGIRSAQVRGQMQRTYAAALDILESGGSMENYELILICSDEIIRNQERRNASYRTNLASNAAELGRLHRDDAGNERIGGSQETLLSFLGSRYSERINRITEGFDSDIRTRFLDYASRASEAGNPEDLRRAREVLNISESMGANLGDTRSLSPEIREGAIEIYRRGLESLDEEGVETARMQTELARMYINADVGQRADIQALSDRLDDGSLEDAQRYLSVQEQVDMFLNRDNGYLLRSSGGLEAMQSLVSEIREIQGQIARGELADGSEEEAEEEWISQKLEMLDQMLRTGAAFIRDLGRTRQREFRRHMSEIYELSIDAMFEGNPESADIYLSGARAYYDLAHSSTTEAREREVIIEVCRGFNNGELDRQTVSSIINIQQLRAEHETAMGSDRELRNTRAYFDLALSSASGRSRERTEAVMEAAIAYASWAAMDETNLTEEQREERNDAMEYVEAQLGDYSRRELGGGRITDPEVAEQVETNAPLASALITEMNGGSFLDSYASGNEEEALRRIQEIASEARGHQRIRDAAAFHNRCESAAEINTMGYQEEAARLEQLAAYYGSRGEEELAEYFEFQALMVRQINDLAGDAIATAREAFENGTQARERAHQLFDEMLATSYADRTTERRISELMRGLPPQSGLRNSFEQRRLETSEGESQQRELYRDLLQVHASREMNNADAHFSNAEQILSGIKGFDRSVALTVSNRHRGRFELFTATRMAMGLARNRDVDALGNEIQDSEGEYVGIVGGRRRQLKSKATVLLRTGLTILNERETTERIRNRGLRNARRNIHDLNIGNMTRMISRMIAQLSPRIRERYTNRLQNAGEDVEELQQLLRALTEMTDINIMEWQDEEGHPVPSDVEYPSVRGFERGAIYDGRAFEEDYQDTRRLWLSEKFNRAIERAREINALMQASRQRVGVSITHRLLHSGLRNSVGRPAEESAGIDWSSLSLGRSQSPEYLRGGRVGEGPEERISRVRDEIGTLIGYLPLSEEESQPLIARYLSLSSEEIEPGSEEYDEMLRLREAVLNAEVGFPGAPTRRLSEVGQGTVYFDPEWFDGRLTNAMEYARAGRSDEAWDELASVRDDAGRAAVAQRMSNQRLGQRRQAWENERHGYHLEDRFTERGPGVGETPTSRQQREDRNEVFGVILDEYKDNCRETSEQIREQADRTTRALGDILSGGEIFESDPETMFEIVEVYMNTEERNQLVSGTDMTYRELLESMDEINASDPARGAQLARQMFHGLVNDSELFSNITDRIREQVEEEPETTTFSASEVNYLRALSGVHITREIGNERHILRNGVRELLIIAYDELTSADRAELEGSEEAREFLHGRHIEEANRYYAARAFELVRALLSVDDISEAIENGEDVEVARFDFDSSTPRDYRSRFGGRLHVSTVGQTYRGWTVKLNLAEELQELNRERYLEISQYADSVSGEIDVDGRLSELGELETERTLAMMGFRTDTDEQGRLVVSPLEISQGGVNRLREMDRRINALVGEFRDNLMRERSWLDPLWREDTITDVLQFLPPIFLVRALNEDWFNFEAPDQYFTSTTDLIDERGEVVEPLTEEPTTNENMEAVGRYLQAGSRRSDIDEALADLRRLRAIGETSAIVGRALGSMALVGLTGPIGALCLGIHSLAYDGFLSQESIAQQYRARGEWTASMGLQTAMLGLQLATGMGAIVAAPAWAGVGAATRAAPSAVSPLTRSATLRQRIANNILSPQWNQMNRTQQALHISSIIQQFGDVGQTIIDAPEMIEAVRTGDMHVLTALTSILVMVGQTAQQVGGMRGGARAGVRGGQGYRSHSRQLFDFFLGGVPFDPRSVHTSAIAGMEANNHFRNLPGASRGRGRVHEGIRLTDQQSSYLNYIEASGIEFSPQTEASMLEGFARVCRREHEAGRPMPTFPEFIRSGEGMPALYAQFENGDVSRESFTEPVPNRAEDLVRAYELYQQVDERSRSGGAILLQNLDPLGRRYVVLRGEGASHADAISSLERERVNSAPYFILREQGLNHEDVLDEYGVLSRPLSDRRNELAQVYDAYSRFAEEHPSESDALLANLSPRERRYIRLRNGMEGPQMSDEQAMRRMSRRPTESVEESRYRPPPSPLEPLRRAAAAGQQAEQPAPDDIRQGLIRRAYREIANGERPEDVINRMPEQDREVLNEERILDTISTIRQQPEYIMATPEERMIIFEGIMRGEDPTEALGSMPVRVASSSEGLRTMLTRLGMLPEGMRQEGVEALSESGDMGRLTVEMWKDRISSGTYRDISLAEIIRLMDSGELTPENIEHIIERWDYIQVERRRFRELQRTNSELAMSEEQIRQLPEEEAERVRGLQRNFRENEREAIRACVEEGEQESLLNAYGEGGTEGRLRVLQEMGIDVNSINEGEYRDRRMREIFDLITRSDLSGRLREGERITSIVRLDGAQGVYRFDVSSPEGRRSIFVKMEDVGPAQLGVDLARSQGMICAEINGGTYNTGISVDGEPVSQHIMISEDVHNLVGRQFENVVLPDGSVGDGEVSAVALLKHEAFSLEGDNPQAWIDLYDNNPAIRELFDRLGSEDARREVMRAWNTYQELSRRAMLLDRRPVNTIVVLLEVEGETVLTFQPFDTDLVAGRSIARPQLDGEVDFSHTPVDSSKVPSFDGDFAFGCEQFIGMIARITSVAQHVTGEDGENIFTIDNSTISPEGLRSELTSEGNSADIPINRREEGRRVLEEYFKNGPRYVGAPLDIGENGEETVGHPLAYGGESLPADSTGRSMLPNANQITRMFYENYGRGPETIPLYYLRTYVQEPSGGSEGGATPPARPQSGEEDATPPARPQSGEEDATPPARPQVNVEGETPPAVSPTQSGERVNPNAEHIDTLLSITEGDLTTSSGLADFSRRLIEGDNDAQRSYQRLDSETRRLIDHMREDSAFQTAVNEGEESYQKHVSTYGARELDRISCEVERHQNRIRGGYNDAQDDLRNSTYFKQLDSDGQEEALALLDQIYGIHRSAGAAGATPDEVTNNILRFYLNRGMGSGEALALMLMNRPEGRIRESDLGGTAQDIFNVANNLSSESQIGVDTGEGRHTGMDPLVREATDIMIESWPDLGPDERLMVAQELGAAVDSLREIEIESRIRRGGEELPGEYVDRITNRLAELKNQRHAEMTHARIIYPGEELTSGRIREINAEIGQIREQMRIEAERMRAEALRMRSSSPNEAGRLFENAQQLEDAALEVDPSSRISDIPANELGRTAQEIRNEIEDINGRIRDLAEDNPELPDIINQRARLIAELRLIEAEVARRSPAGPVAIQGGGERVRTPETVEPEAAETPETTPQQLTNDGPTELGRTRSIYNNHLNGIEPPEGTSDYFTLRYVQRLIESGINESEALETAAEVRTFASTVDPIHVDSMEMPQGDIDHYQNSMRNLILEFPEAFMPVESINMDGNRVHAGPPMNLGGGRGDTVIAVYMPAPDGGRHMSLYYLSESHDCWRRYAGTLQIMGHARYNKGRDQFNQNAHWRIQQMLDRAVQRRAESGEPPVDITRPDEEGRDEQVALYDFIPEERTNVMWADEDGVQESMAEDPVTLDLSVPGNRPSRLVAAWQAGTENDIYGRHIRMVFESENGEYIYVVGATEDGIFVEYAQAAESGANMAGSPERSVEFSEGSSQWFNPIVDYTGEGGIRGTVFDRQATNVGSGDRVRTSDPHMSRGSPFHQLANGLQNIVGNIREGRFSDAMDAAENIRRNPNFINSAPERLRVPPTPEIQQQFQAEVKARRRALEDGFNRSRSDEDLEQSSEFSPGDIVFFRRYAEQPEIESQIGRRARQQARDWIISRLHEGDNVLLRSFAGGLEGTPPQLREMMGMFSSMDEPQQDAIIGHIRRMAGESLEEAGRLRREGHGETVAQEANQRAESLTERAIQLEELRALSGNIGRELENTYGLDPGTLRDIYMESNLLPGSRSNLMSILGIDVPQGDHDIYGMLITGNLISVIRNMYPDATSIGMRNIGGGVTGAYMVEVTDARGTHREFVKKVDMNPDRAGSENLRLSGIPAAEVRTTRRQIDENGAYLTDENGEYLQQPLRYVTESGETSAYGISSDIREFEGTVRINGRNIRLRARDATSFGELTSSPELTRIMRENPEILFHALGYAYGASFALNAIDGHMNNFYGMITEIVDPSPEDIRALENAGFMITRRNDGTYQTVMAGRIDTDDSAGMYSAFTHQGGQFDFSAYETHVSSRMFTQLFASMARQYNIAETRRCGPWRYRIPPGLVRNLEQRYTVVEDNGAYYIHTYNPQDRDFLNNQAHFGIVRVESPSETPNFISPRELVGQYGETFRQGAMSWHRNHSSDQGYRNAITSGFRNREGQPIGVSSYMLNDAQLRELRTRGYTRHGFPGNGEETMLVFRPDGRGTMFAEYERVLIGTWPPEIQNLFPDALPSYIVPFRDGMEGMTGTFINHSNGRQFAVFPYGGLPEEVSGQAALVWRHGTFIRGPIGMGQATGLETRRLGAVPAFQSIMNMNQGGFREHFNNMLRRYHQEERGSEANLDPNLQPNQLQRDLFIFLRLPPGYGPGDFPKLP